MDPAAVATVSVVCPHCLVAQRGAVESFGAASCAACGRPLFDGRPAAVSADQSERHLNESEVPIVVDFWAQWCAPCRTIAPVFEAAARELDPRFRLLTVNTDEAPELAVRHAIYGLPTVAIFSRGREVARVTGALAGPRVTSWIRSHG